MEGMEGCVISWNQEPEGVIPAGTSITVEARAADTEADLASETFVSVTNGTGAGVTGQFVEIRATLFNGNSVFTSPVLSDLTIECNEPPVADANGPYECDEGSTITLDASGSNDPDDDIVMWEWDLDEDGEYDDATGETVEYSCPDGPADVTVGLKVTDGYGASDTDTATVKINNDCPSVGQISVSETLVAMGTSINASANFTDPGTADTHTAQWDWDANGGGDITSGTVAQGAGSGSVSDSHTYTAPGVYTIELTVTDDDGCSATNLFQYVVVYDPNDGFVTGGGWIDSPAGAYVPDPSLTGRATFGFVSKYKRREPTPTGNTEFQFHAGDLNFHSNTYYWLVIAHHKAVYKGEGTINGGGNYGFILFAIDEKLTPSSDVDMFRIKIWDMDSDTVVYDNELGEDLDADPITAIGGGSIVIHKK
jgi:PKD repeat protein